MNHQAAASLDRVRTALMHDSDGVRKFVLEKTRINGKPFSLKNHEYQGKVLELVSSPTIDLVAQKPAQIGFSEIVYRVILSYMCRVPGFSSAIVFPTAKMSSEVVSTRIAQIINDCEPLAAIKNKDVDSSTVKQFLNGSLLYALGASPISRSTTINRPVRLVCVDEFPRADLDQVTAMRSRQRHQEHKSSIYFGTPLIEFFDISAEMQKCGTIWEQILSCSRCGHQFFPDFYRDVRLPGFKDPIKFLTQEEVEKTHLNITDSYLSCPKCERSTTFEFDQMTWVDTETNKLRPKIGMKLSAFAMPHYVKVPNMVGDLLAYSDKAEFSQQCLGLPATKAETAMDSSQIQFVNDEAGAINVCGIDVGNTCTVTIGTVSSDTLFIHTIVFIFLKDIDIELPKLLSSYRCVATVIDYGPNTTLSVKVSNSYPNAWVALYSVPATPQTELVKLKIVDDEALGVVKQCTINKNPYFDSYVESLMQGRVKFKNGDNNAMVRDHHESLRRIRDPKSIEAKWIWIKPQKSKTVDHIFHSSVYCSVAMRLMQKGSAMSLPMSSLVKGFKLKSDL